MDLNGIFLTIVSFFLFLYFIWADSCLMSFTLPVGSKGVKFISNDIIQAVLIKEEDRLLLKIWLLT